MQQHHVVALHSIATIVALKGKSADNGNEINFRSKNGMDFSIKIKARTTILMIWDGEWKDAMDMRGSELTDIALVLAVQTGIGSPLL